MATQGGHRDVRGPRSPRCAGNRRAIALLEVVLAIAIFFALSAAVLSGLDACVRSAKNMKLSARASNLAITVMSEVQVGALPVSDAGPNAFDDPLLADWTWEVGVTPIQNLNNPALDLSRVEVVIRNTVEGYTRRSYGVMPAPKEETTSGGTSLASAGSGGTP
jgi:hypothetical protein